MIDRSISVALKKWAASAPSERKVLLLRGARQVGKTYAVRELGKSFETYLEINFIENPEIKKFFAGGSLDPNKIIQNIAAYYSTSLPYGKSLLFFDEIQACPEAIVALRFFYEKIPELHVVAAGSLLEFALGEISSFGVGRIISLFMYPLSLAEFFEATKNSQLLELIATASHSAPLNPVLHQRCLELVKVYLLIGGLPEVVSKYIDTKDIPACQSLLQSLLNNYEDDFSKYGQKVNTIKLGETLRSVALQTGKKFVYSHVSPGNSSIGYSDALELLVKAGLVYRTYHTSANGIPIGAEIDLKKFKVFPFDLGIYQALLGFKSNNILLLDALELINSGPISELLVALELVVNQDIYARAGLYYWVREAKNSNSEVDFVVQVGQRLYPIEVKAGTKGQMQSMYRFMQEKNGTLGVRCSLENFAEIKRENGTVKILPIYAVSQLARVVEQG